MKGILSYLKAYRPVWNRFDYWREWSRKELIADALHQLGGAEKPWIAVNVAGLDDVIFSDTLFGHVRGAFTGADSHRQGMIEEASGGTLFLDEIGDLAPASQIKLLRMLQEREFYPLGSDKSHKLNARIVVATNRNLSELELAGSFRRDLLYRLNAHRLMCRLCAGGQRTFLFYLSILLKMLPPLSASPHPSVLLNWFHCWRRIIFPATSAS